MPVIILVLLIVLMCFMGIGFWKAVLGTIAVMFLGPVAMILGLIAAVFLLIVILVICNSR